MVLFHRAAFRLALGGARVIAAYEIGCSPFVFKGKVHTGYWRPSSPPRTLAVWAVVGHTTSMIWFGSPAVVALAYVIAFFVMLALIGFHPDSVRRGG
jgi:hypothetical protein